MDERLPPGYGRRKESRTEGLLWNGSKKFCFNVKTLDSFRFQNFGRRYLRWAEQYPHLIRTAGSDFHQPEDLEGAYVVFKEELYSEEELRDALKKQAFTW